MLSLSTELHVPHKSRATRRKPPLGGRIGSVVRVSDLARSLVVLVAPRYEKQEVRSGASDASSTSTRVPQNAVCFGTGGLSLLPSLRRA